MRGITLLDFGFRSLKEDNIVVLKVGHANGGERSNSVLPASKSL